MSTPLNLPEDRAAAWAARLEVAPLTRAEAQELQAWLDGDARHAALLAEFVALSQSVHAELPAMARDGLLAPARRRARTAAWWRFSLRGLAAAAAIALAVGWFMRRPQEFSTAAGQRAETVLADGSHVALNARTTLAVTLRRGERRVRLEQGEAYFEVAKDAARPFFVETPAGTVRVTGTHFNVRADTPEALEVTVLEGSVAVRVGPGERALAPDDQLEFNGVTTKVQRLGDDVARNAIAWREGRFICGSLPLRVVLDRYARYHDVAIEVAPTVETLPVGGIFRLDDLDGFLRDLRETLPVHVLRTPDGHRVRILPR